MTTFQELFQKGRTVSRLGSTTFKPNLMKEVIMTPHERMSRVLDMLESRPTVMSSLTKYMNYVMGQLSFKSSDQKSADFMNKWLELRENRDSSIKTEIYNFALLLAGCGNSYFEATYSEQNGMKVLDNLYHIPDPSTIYFNLDEKNGKIDDEEYWLMEVPFDVRTFRGLTPQYKVVYYIRGSTLARKRVWCIALPKDKIIHKKIGWSRDGYYGTGFLSPAVDDDDILREILKNWALIAKYKALGKKLIGVFNENGEMVHPEELDDIEEKFRQLEEEDSMFINKKFVSDSFTFVGENDNMDMQIGWLQKDIGSGLVPNYLTPFSQDNALATADEAKNPFMLDLLSFQDTLSTFLEQIILPSLRQQYTWLADDIVADLGKPDIYSHIEKFATVSQLYNMRAATFNELRIAAGYEAVENGDTWGTEPPLDDIPARQPSKPLIEKVPKPRARKESVPKVRKSRRKESKK